MLIRLCRYAAVPPSHRRHLPPPKPPVAVLNPSPEHAKLDGSTARRPCPGISTSSQAPTYDWSQQQRQHNDSTGFGWHHTKHITRTHTHANTNTRRQSGWCAYERIYTFELTQTTGGNSSTPKHTHTYLQCMQLA